MTCASCGASNRDGAKFCDVCGAALAVEPAREQRKVVTVLFCDVSGSTALGERLDPEALRTVMGRYFDVAREAIERHGGTLEKFIGDAVMAVFGIPTVREDDALRAVRAAQELRDGVEIDVRIGVNTGEVVTGSADSLVTGDAVNVAARLEQAAGAGEVLLGAATYGLVRDAVDAQLLPPLEAKGKAEPLTAYRLAAVTGDVGLARRLDAPLVGRGRERRLLAGAWERARSEQACVLFTMLGAAGVGKSRLAAEFLDDLDATIVSGRCLSYGEGITYWPVVEVVLQLLGGEQPPSAALAALLGEGQAPADEIAFAVRKLFEARAAQRPLVVLFDDLQWAEPTFLDLIEHVADWSRDAPILLLCLGRPDLLDRRTGWGGGKLNATTVLLEPLSAAETDVLIDELLAGQELEPALRVRIRAAAEGNPLFVEQMLAMLQESPGEVTVPATIQALLAARLDQLPPLERAALERGAIEGQVFHRGAVAALDGDPAGLLPLVRKELVRPSVATLPGDDAFRFRHLLIRDAAYDSLPKSVRADLHGRFAAWLEEHAPELVELDEIVGYHLEQASHYQAELGAPDEALRGRAAERLGRAGARADAREDSHAAASLLRRAVDLYPGDDARRLPLLAALGAALHELGRLEEAYAILDEAIAGKDADASAQAFFFKTLASGHGQSISPVELEAATRRRLDALGSSASPRTLAAGQHAHAFTLFWAGRIREGSEAATRAAHHARAAGDRALEVAALRHLIGFKLQDDTPWDEVLRLAGEVEAAGIPVGGIRGDAAAMQGRFDEARRLWDAFLQEQRERGRLIFAAGVSHQYGVAELLAGEYERAEQLLRRSWDELGELGERGYRSTGGGLLGGTLARLGRLDEADAILDEAMSISTPDDWVTVAQVTSSRALVASARGEHDRACALAREAVELVDRHEYLSLQVHMRLEASDVLLAAGRGEEAQRVLGELIELAERKGSTAYVMLAEARLSAGASS